MGYTRQSLWGKCLAVQRDSKLSVDQKLEKQKMLSDEIAKEVKADSRLKESDKKGMLDSIQNYMNDWTTMHDLIYEKPQAEKPSPKTSPKKNGTKK